MVNREHLEALRTEKLESMIREDIDGSGDYDPDIISEILDILVERNDTDPEIRAAKVEAAWRRFQASLQQPKLTPSPGGRECLGNGEWPGYECCCHECDYMLICFSMGGEYA